jgi:hypothetical protein
LTCKNEAIGMSTLVTAKEFLQKDMCRQPKNKKCGMVFFDEGLAVLVTDVLEVIERL